MWVSADPILGRYLNSEIGLGGIYNSMNVGLYSYAHNNPLIYTDPDGNFVDTAKLAQMSANATRAAFATDLATPEPTDAAWPKWVGWGVALAVTGAVEWALSPNQQAAPQAQAQPTPQTSSQTQSQAREKRKTDDSTVMYHYSPLPVLKGPLRPNSYVTPNGNLSSDEAANYLALNPANVPDGTQMYVHPVQLQSGEYRSANNSLPGNVVKPDAGRGGGGIEFQTNVPKTTMPSYPARPPGSDYHPSGGN